MDKRLTLLKTYTRSVASDTNIAGSDEDTVIIVSDTLSELIGLDGTQKGKVKSSPEVDETVYTFSHFIDIAVKGSSNATNILFMPPETWVKHMAGFWEAVYAERFHFLGQSTYWSFLKHAESQIESGWSFMNVDPMKGAKQVAQGLTLVFNLEELIMYTNMYTPKVSNEFYSQDIITALKRGDISISKAIEDYNLKNRLEWLRNNRPSWNLDRKAIDALKIKLNLQVIHRYQ